MKKLILLIIMLTLLIVSCTNNVQQSNYTDDNNEEKLPEENVDEEDVPANEELEIDRNEYLMDNGVELSYPENTSQEQKLLLNGITLTKDIIRSVYRVYKGEENYTYEVLLFSLAINDDENNLYKGYFPFDEDKGGFIFPLNKSNEVLIDVFGDKEYPSLKDVFDYDEESDTYYKNLDFGWNTGYIAENITADISDDESKLYTKFELINLWFDVEGDPVPTAVAECKITYSINKSNDKIYLQFENMEILSRMVN